MLCYLAAVAAGSTDGQEMADKLIDITAPGGDEFTWQQLPDAIKALENGKDIDYTGASGPIDMDVHGDPTAGRLRRLPVQRATLSRWPARSRSRSRNPAAP